MKGAEIVLACLRDHQVDTLFGYPGGAVIPLYDALHRQGQGFTHVRTAHEQGAVHAADGYARTTGKTGVVIATSGPGATNTVTGIATAFMDSSPLVILTGQVPSSLLGRDSFQEIDITGMTVPITKHNFLVRKIEDLEETLHQALVIANSGRPGPVLVDITKDVLLDQCAYRGFIGYKEPVVATEGDLDQALKLIRQAKRPVIYAGGGVGMGDAAATLLDLATKGDIPVVNTLMGLGSIPRSHPLSLGLVGMHGFPEANDAISKSDLVIAVGARFSDRVTGAPGTFAPSAKIIHVDIDPTEFSKNVQVSLRLRGQVDIWLKALVHGIDPMDHGDWRREIASSVKPISFVNHMLTPASIIGLVAGRLSEASVVTDVGQHQMWTAQYWPFQRTRQFITSGGLGTMGFGMGAAMGTAKGIADQPVVLITGDGSFRMNSNELSTLAEAQLPVTIILMNNGALGMVRQWQKLFQDRRYEETCITDSIDYVKLAEAYGIQGFDVSTPQDLQEALAWEGLGKEPVLINCRILKDEDVWPIVPPGKAITNFILG